jgi:uncharacterized membrane protein
MRRNVGTLERVASVAAGLLLVTATRRTRARPVAAVIGTGLLARGVTGYCPVKAAGEHGRARDDTRVALGGPRGVHVNEAVTVRAPCDEVYDFWRTLSNLPQFMSHLARVDVSSDGRSHWVAQGPAGSRVEWDAEIINDKRPELIAWRSLEGAEVASAGSVRFRPAPGGGTEIIVRLQYEPPAGKLGAWVAALFGEEPSQQIRDDLRRLKQRFDRSGNLSLNSALPDRLQPQPEVG